MVKCVPLFIQSTGLSATAAGCSAAARQRLGSGSAAARQRLGSGWQRHAPTVRLLSRAALIRHGGRRLGLLARLRARRPCSPGCHITGRSDQEDPPLQRATPRQQSRAKYVEDPEVFPLADMDFGSAPMGTTQDCVLVLVVAALAALRQP